jgi:hypothetical protein
MVDCTYTVFGPRDSNQYIFNNEQESKPESEFMKRLVVTERSSFRQTTSTAQHALLMGVRTNRYRYSLTYLRSLRPGHVNEYRARWTRPRRS